MNQTAKHASQLGSNRSSFLEHFIEGLGRDQKAVSPRWLYDEEGSKLFEEITKVEAYYPTRVETQILSDNASTIADYIGTDATLIEYGAGASRKTRILLSALDRPRSYVPIDISEDFLKASAASIAKAFPGLDVRPVVADFMSDVDLSFLPCLHQTGFFPGSTIGNLEDEAIDQFFINARRALGSNATFILGYDLIKDKDTLIRAYDDPEGVTAKFNRNLLLRANRELDANFDVAQFRHEARWNEDLSRVEMHLVADEGASVTIDGWHFHFLPGESLHTENSRKFEIDRLSRRLADTGWIVERTLTDPDKMFAVSMMRAKIANE